MIDYSITIGNLIEIAAIVGGGVLALVTLRSTVSHIQEDMSDMKTEIKKVGEVLIKMATTDVRLSAVEQDIRDLKHGRGFIQPRESLNGEYP